MARVKRAVNAQKKRRVVLERASGYRGQRSRLYRKAKEQVTHSLVYSYNDRKKQGRLPQALDPADQRRRPRQRPDLQPLHPGPQGRGCRGRPQDPGRPGRQRRPGLRRPRRDRQGQPARGRQRAGFGLTAGSGSDVPVRLQATFAMTVRSPSSPRRSGRVKAARKLTRRSTRAEQRLFLAEGAKALTEALHRPGRGGRGVRDRGGERAVRRPAQGRRRGRRPLAARPTTTRSPRSAGR